MRSFARLRISSPAFFKADFAQGRAAREFSVRRFGRRAFDAGFGLGADGGGIGILNEVLRG